MTTSITKTHSPKQVPLLGVFVKSTPDRERQVSKIATNSVMWQPIKEFSKSLKRFPQMISNKFED